MKEINNNIKEKKFHRAYLLYGDEKFLVTTYKNRLREAVIGDDTMNLAVYQGKGTDVNDVGGISTTVPFFAEHRLIIIENSGMFKSSSEEMTRIVKEAPETTIFIFTDDEVDKRNRLYKAVKEVGYVCEMKTRTDRELIDWVASVFGKYGKRIRPEDAAKFVGTAGPDMNNLYNEAMKVAAYAGDSDVITSDDIDNMVSVQPEDRIFDMINAMALHKKDKAMSLYSDLLELREPSVKILSLISRQFSQLLAVKDMLESGADKKDISSRLGINPYFTGGYISQAKAYSRERIMQSLSDCINTEYMIKSGITEDKFSVEMLIVKFCEE